MERKGCGRQVELFADASRRHALGATATSKRKIESRDSCANALSDCTACFISIFLE